MSLLENAYEDFAIINKVMVDDGYGGIKPQWNDGPTIKGVAVFDGSTQMKIAQAMGVTSTYTFTVHKDIELDYHAVVRRLSDGLVLRLTSGNDDKKTPSGANLDMRQYSAEEWSLTQ